jgi:predicted membrane channel-forming protein YqfA (hemolysin III family)
MNIFDPPLNKIKHADWPFLLVHLIVYSVGIIVFAFLLDQTAETVAFFILTVFFLLSTLSHFYRAFKEETEHLQYKIQAIGEIQRLIPLRAPYPTYDRVGRHTGTCRNGSQANHL